MGPIITPVTSVTKVLAPAAAACESGGEGRMHLGICYLIS